MPFHYYCISQVKQTSSMDSKPNNIKKFGTFGGFITPTLFTILGVIMYLRISWVVRNTGLLGT